MAEHAIYIVPSNPHFIPTKEAQEQALAFFKEVSPLPNANGDYYWNTYDRPVLIDSGEALERAICPCCAKAIDIFGEDNEDWWSETQEDIYKNIEGFIEMPCCGKQAKIIELKFDSLSVFARFAIGALEPSQSDHWENEDTLKAPTLAKLKEIIGCPVLVIWSVG